MTKLSHIVVLDTVSFSGGSKVATENILRLLDTTNIHITILTADINSWHWRKIQRIPLYQPNFLIQRIHGLLYFLSHLVIAIQIIFVRLRFGEIDIAIGSSGPGVDLALYICKYFLNFRLIQLIHGHVANSRTNGICLLNADETYYLKSTKKSLLATLHKVTHNKHSLNAPQFNELTNGLSAHNWPNRQHITSPVIFWSASLLKWKGLDFFVEALNTFEDSSRPETHICYIQPKNIKLDISHAPVEINNVRWYQKPNNLNEIRANSNIFVSTSENEPFGLSILESLASGHCVLIPRDGSYWDKKLQGGLNCIKYQANNTKDLTHKITLLMNNMFLVKSIGDAAEKLAKRYTAKKCYAPLIDSINHTLSKKVKTTSSHHKILSQS